MSSADEDDDNEEKWEIPESKERRMLELRLQQNFIENVTKTIGSCNTPQARHAWAVEVPKLALSNDNVLYAILALSAFHLHKSAPDDRELLLAHRLYTGLAFREHRKGVALLSSETADAVCYASTALLIVAFALLQDRPLDPWTPPMEWISMARGSGSVFGAVFDRKNNFRISKIMPIVEAKPDLTDATVIFATDNRRGLDYLLRQDLSNELWDQETQEAYERAVSYIGGVRIAVEGGEHQLETCRRMMAFAMLGPKKFYSFVEEYRPRALVILAHFFAIYSRLRDIWWIGNIAQTEIQGIYRILSPEWQELMKGPLAAVGL